MNDGHCAAMNSRERVLAAIERKPYDRVPTDFWATGETVQKLKRHFGEDVDLRAQFHIDGISGVDAAYVGPTIPAMPAGESADMWGMRYKNMDYGQGVYSEQVYHPLAPATTIDDLEKYAWPQPGWFDCSSMRASALQARSTHALMCGYMAPFYFHNKLRGLEQSLVDPLESPEFTHHLLRRLADSFVDHHRRMFEACDGLIDIAQVTDDYGSQAGPMISLDVFRTFYKPHLQRFITLCKDFGIKVFHHDDGSMSEFLPDLVQMGIDVLNPVQWNCPGMDMQKLKQEFGQRLCFHGAVENQSILPFGTPEDVRAEVRHCIDALANDGTGYILGPCHNIQVNTPVENIVAMYDEAWHYGKR